MFMDYLKNLIMGVAEKNSNSKIVNFFKKNSGFDIKNFKINKSV